MKRTKLTEVKSKRRSCAVDSSKGAVMPGVGEAPNSSIDASAMIEYAGVPGAFVNALGLGKLQRQNVHTKTQLMPALGDCLESDIDVEAELRSRPLQRCLPRLAKPE